MIRIPLDPTAGLAAQVRGHEQSGPVRGVRLYRFWAGLELVYVGITCHIPGRWQAHKNHADWWPLIDSVSLSEPYRNMAEARYHELIAIRGECPSHNKHAVIWQGNGTVRVPDESMSTHGRCNERLMESSVNDHCPIHDPRARPRIRERGNEGTRERGNRDQGIFGHLNPKPRLT